MQYTEVTFHTPFTEEYQWDMFYQGLADMGFESFMDEKAYIQTEQLNLPAMQAYANEQGVEVTGVMCCPDENWNATWEAEHEMEELPLGVKIIPHCAFGAGHHETTGMMVQAIINLAKQQPLGHVLDQGCGTGILGIYADLLGATHVTAVDIDDKSVANTRENAILNNAHVDAQLGSQVPDGQYDLILANIHRNILLSMMPRFAATTATNGWLFLSGFYAEDVPVLVEAAQQVGFCLEQHHCNGEWQMLAMRVKK